MNRYDGNLEGQSAKFLLYSEALINMYGHNSAQKQDQMWIRAKNVAREGMSKLLQALQHSKVDSDPLKPHCEKPSVSENAYLSNLGYDSSWNLKQKYQERQSSQSSSESIVLSSSTDSRAPLSPDSRAKQSNANQPVKQIFSLGSQPAQPCRKGQTPKRSRSQNLKIHKILKQTCSLTRRNPEEARIQKQINILFHKQLNNKQQSKLQVPADKWEIFKKIFVAKLMKYLDNIEPSEQQGVISKFATLLGVLKSEVYVWLDAYPMIYAVDDEDEVSVKRLETPLTEEMKVEQLKNQLLIFMEEHPTVKNSQMTRIIECAFNALGIDQNVADWQRKFMFENQKGLESLRRGGVIHEQADSRQNNPKNEVQNSLSQEELRKKRGNKQKNHKIQQNRLTAEIGSSSDSEGEPSDESYREETPSPKRKTKTVRRKQSQKRPKQLPKQIKQLQAKLPQEQPKTLQGQQPCDKAVFIEVPKQSVTPVEMDEIEGYPPQLEQKIAQSIDKAFSRSMNTIIRRQADLFGMSKEQIRRIHEKLGENLLSQRVKKAPECLRTSARSLTAARPQSSASDSEIASEKEQLIEIVCKDSDNEQPLQLQNAHIDQTNRDMEIPIDKDSSLSHSADSQAVPAVHEGSQINLQSLQLYNILEQKLLKYVRKHPDCNALSLQTVTDSIMSRLGFTPEMQKRARDEWFAYFLRKYQIRIPQQKVHSYQSE